jgi:lipopolysaccharide assembly outer membrane protein LptD (OstA)
MDKKRCLNQTFVCFRSFVLLFLLTGPVFLPGCGVAMAQQTRQIEILHAESIEFDKAIGPNTQRLIGDVVFKHQEVTMNCDSAWFYASTNSLDAFGHIHIRQSDTLNLYGDLLRYEGNTRMARMRNNVRLIDNQTVLTTNSLDYDLKNSVGFYTGKGKITNGDNVLESERGYYFTRTKNFHFSRNVLITNPDYTINADTLCYNTVSRIAYFHGPTKIVSDSNTIYCENGWYDTRFDKAQFNRNAFLSSGKQWITGDSMYYDRRAGFGKAIANVSVFDSVQKVLLKGQYGEYTERPQNAMLTDSALFIQISGQDSLFVHADTLRSVEDTVAQTKTLFAYYKVKIYKSDMQAKCDSLTYSTADSTFRMYGTPVLWSDENQLTSTFIEIRTRSNRPYRIDLYQTAFIASREDSSKFNQIRGKNMTGYIDEDGKLYRIDVTGNGQSVYYTKDGPDIVGVNSAESTDMVIYLKDRKVQRIALLTKPSGTIYPPGQAPEEELILKGFSWLEKFRPRTKDDIFFW